MVAPIDAPAVKVCGCCTTRLPSCPAINPETAVMPDPPTVAPCRVTTARRGKLPCGNTTLAAAVRLIYEFPTSIEQMPGRPDGKLYRLVIVPAGATIKSFSRK